MEIKNTVEGFVMENLMTVLDQYPEACRCEKCCRDIAILALNNLPAKYAATEKGDTYTRLSLYTQENNLAIIREIAKAIEIVMKNPHHGDA